MPDENAQHTVAVVGATGHTGRFVVAELLRRGIAPVAIARDADGLAAAFAGTRLAKHAVQLDDGAALDRALSHAQAVINCAGPFLDTASAIAAAAIRTGIHYLDVTAEQASAAETLDRFDEPARSAGLSVLPAMGFYGGFADLLATAAMGDWDSADSIEIAIGLDGWHPTRGTRLTGARNSAPRLVRSRGELVPLPVPPTEKRWEFGDPLGRHTVVALPFPETILIARHLAAPEIHTWLSAVALAEIRDPRTPAPMPADESGRSAQRFVVEAVAKRATAVRAATARGRDIYAFTAPFVCEAAEQLVQGRVHRPGAHPPGAIFAAADVLRALSPEHIRLEVRSIA